jgi:hypothetical protein
MYNGDLDRKVTTGCVVPLVNYVRIGPVITGSDLRNISGNINLRQRWALDAKPRFLQAKRREFSSTCASAAREEASLVRRCGRSCKRMLGGVG